MLLTTLATTPGSESLEIKWSTIKRLSIPISQPPPSSAINQMIMKCIGTTTKGSTSNGLMDVLALYGHKARFMEQHFHQQHSRRLTLQGKSFSLALHNDATYRPEIGKKLFYFTLLAFYGSIMILSKLTSFLYINMSQKKMFLISIQCCQIHLSI